jgi:hypothetical protein
MGFGGLGRAFGFLPVPFAFAVATGRAPFVGVGLAVVTVPFVGVPLAGALDALLALGVGVSLGR